MISVKWGIVLSKTSLIIIGISIVVLEIILVMFNNDVLKRRNNI